MKRTLLYLFHSPKHLEKICKHLQKFHSLLGLVKNPLVFLRIYQSVFKKTQNNFNNFNYFPSGLLMFIKFNLLRHKILVNMVRNIVLL